MSRLFELPKEDRKEKSSEIISLLIKAGFIETYKDFIIKNYPFETDNKKYEMFNARIKALYKTFVLDQDVNEADFVNTLSLACSFNKSLTNHNFNDLLEDYKAGLYDYMFDEEEDD